GRGRCQFSLTPPALAGPRGLPPLIWWARRRPMTIRLDHTIVPTRNEAAAAKFFAEIFGLKVKLGRGYFAQVRVNESLSFDFADDSDAWGEPAKPRASTSPSP